MGFCDSYVVTDTYLRLPKKFDTKRKLIKKSPTSMLPSWYKIFEETQRDGTVKYWCEQGGFATSTTDADQTTYIHVEYLDTNYTLLNTMCSTSTATLYNISHIGFQTKTTSSFVSRLSSELSREWTAQGYCNAPDDYIPTPTYEYVVLGTKAEQVETVIETNQIVTDLGNKLDKDIANASVRIETIADEWSSGTEWYIIYKRPQADGTVKYWCEQGGMIQASPNAWSTVMLHVPQVNNQYLCMSNSYDFLSIDYFSVGGAVGQATPTSFTIGNAWNYDVVFNWTAEGYCNAPTTEIN